MFVSKSTKRGFGECPQCWHSYFNRRKPPNCEKFGYHPGGTNESPPPKKPKRNCSSAVFFVGSSHFSRKTSTKDERVLLATAVHGRASDICIVWSCGKLLLQTCRPFLWCRSCQFQTFHLSAANTENYKGDSASLGYKPIRLKLSRKTAYKDVLEAVNDNWWYSTEKLTSGELLIGIYKTGHEPIL